MLKRFLIGILCGVCTALPLAAQQEVVPTETIQVDSLQKGVVVVPDSTNMLMTDSMSVLMPDSALQVQSAEIAEQAKKLSVPKFVPNPTRALWLSLVFPGAGQIYNRKYWKLPIIYGGFLGCAYALNWNQQMLKDYSQAYLDIMDSDPNTKSYEKMLPIGYDIRGKEDQFKEIFKNKKNYYRKYRDMSILAFGGVYLIAVIDAYVDAELSTFDISEDLSLQLTPAVISNEKLNTQSAHSSSCADPYADRGVGMALKLNF